MSSLHQTVTDAHPAERPPIALLFTALLLIMLLGALDQTIVSTALPTIVGELGGLENLSWVVTSYLLTSTIVVPLTIGCVRRAWNSRRSPWLATAPWTPVSATLRETGGR